jgi:hypothetical protein
MSLGPGLFAGGTGAGRDRALSGSSRRISSINRARSCDVQLPSMRSPNI